MPDRRTPNLRQMLSPVPKAIWGLVGGDLLVPPYEYPLLRVFGAARQALDGLEFA